MRRFAVSVVAVLVGAGVLAALAAPGASGDQPRAERGSSAGPLVIGHRGASGYRPEHTLASYELAARMGADYIEPDVVSTKDHVLVARHENEISGTTDVADRPQFASRRATKVIDGAPVTGWFTEDFTLAELRTLHAKERLPDLRQENTLFDGRWTVPTLAEVFQLRERLSKQLGRPVGVIPETKHPTYFRSIGLPLEDPLVDLVRRHRLDAPAALIVVQSFELNNLVLLRDAYRVKAKLAFLTAATGKGYGDPQTYAELLTPAGLSSVSRWVNALGPEKNQVIPRTPDGSLGAPTSLVADAHTAGLSVFPYTFRAENTFLPTNLRAGTSPQDFGNAITESVTFLKAGVDGLFCDQPDICLQARTEFTAHP